MTQAKNLSFPYSKSYCPLNFKKSHQISGFCCIPNGSYKEDNLKEGRIPPCRIGLNLAWFVSPEIITYNSVFLVLYCPSFKLFKFKFLKGWFPEDRKYGDFSHKWLSFRKYGDFSHKWLSFRKYGDFSHKWLSFRKYGDFSRKWLSFRKYGDFSHKWLSFVNTGILAISGFPFLNTGILAISGFPILNANFFLLSDVKELFNTNRTSHFPPLYGDFIL